MSIYELIERVGGEIVGNTAQVRQGKDYIVIAKHNGVDFSYTEAGSKLANQFADEPKQEILDDNKPRRGRKAKGLVLGSETALSDDFEIPVFSQE